MIYRGVLLDFGGVVATVRAKLIGEEGSSPYAVDIEAQVIDAIGRLRSGGVACALVTNNDRRSFTQHFGHLPLDVWFDVVVFSSDVDADKPHPPIYLEALRQLGLEAEDCVFLDDLARNVDAAIALGMQGFIVESCSAAADYLQTLIE